MGIGTGSEFITHEEIEIKVDFNLHHHKLVLTIKICDFDTNFVFFLLNYTFDSNFYKFVILTSWIMGICDLA
jgi:hypothetical protein